MSPADSTAQPRRLASAVQWAFVMSWGPNAIATLLTFVLAAYLGPHDYGVVAMAALYISFVQMFLEGGLGTAIVQRKDLEPEHLDAVFWITLSFSLAIMLVTWLISPFWAAANHTDELYVVMNVLSITLPIQGLTVVQESLLERNLDFKSLAIRSNISTLVGGIFGLTLAVKGFGVWALVGEDLLSAMVRLVLLWRLGAWRPAMRFSMRHIKELFGFSFWVLIAQIGTFVQRRSDALLIGLFFGPAAVGIYRLGDRLISTVIELATRPFVMVVLPHFSKLQSNFVELRKAIMNCVRTSSMITLPMLAVASGMAYLICSVLSMRGNDWGLAVNVIQILALVGAARAITLLVGPLMQAINRPRLSVVLSWSLAGANTIAFCAAGWLLQHNADVRYQAMGVAAARAVVFCLFYMPISLYIMCRICQLKGRDVLRSIMPAVITSVFVVITGQTVEYLMSLIHRPSPIMKVSELLIGGMITSSVALGLMYMFEPSVGKFINKKLGRLRGPVIAPAAGTATAFEVAAATNDATTVAKSGTETGDLHPPITIVPTTP